jgi:hypothetical protein
MRSQVHDEPSQGDYMLDACILFGCNGYVKIFLRESFPYLLWGSNPQDFFKLVHSRKEFHLEVEKIVFIKLKWNTQGKGLFLIGFLFYRSYVLVWRPGYRIGSCTIKRGSRVSNLIASFEESSNL